MPLTIPTVLMAGGMLRIKFSTYDNTVTPPVLADPSSGLGIYIDYPTNGKVVVSAGACIKDGTGLYHYDYQSAVTDGLGPYRVWFQAIFSGTQRSVPVGAITLVA